MKQLYALLDKEDLFSLLKYMNQSRVDIYTHWGVRFQLPESAEMIDNSQIYCILPSGSVPVFRKIKSKTWISEETACVWIHPTLISPTGLYTPGPIGVSSITTPEVNAIFRVVATYIKASYQRTYDGGVYIAPTLLSKWRSGQISFHFFVTARVVDILQTDFCIEALFHYMQTHGCIIREDGRDIRAQDSNLNIHADNYILFFNGAALKEWIACRKRYYYPESECVFLWRQKNKIRLIADGRFFESGDSNGPVVQMFQLIKDYCNRWQNNL